ncbi:MAG: proline dehydrogenase family protein [Bacteroidetes bacterium]|nr:proline dehydrogenase family protein [Bacteroidota bacterium]
MEENTTVSFENTSIAFSSKSDFELKKMYFIFASVDNQFIAKVGTGLAKAGLKLNLPIKWLIRKTVYEHFCGGEDITLSQPTVEELAKYNVETILDYSVESGKDEMGFEATAQEILRTVENASKTASIPFCVFKISGIASTKLLENVQIGDLLDSQQQQALQNIKQRINKLCQSAYDHHVPIMIDAEETWIQDVIDEMVYEMMAMYNQQKAIVWNTYQLYRKDTLGNLQHALEQANKEGFFLGAKLVRGAYIEKERNRAKDMGYEDPMQPNKDATDNDYNQALTFCIENCQRISLCCGSHNEYSNYFLMELMKKKGLRNDDKRVYFAQLYGMSDHISFNLAHAGYNVVKYVPYGPLTAVMPYLFRRAEENTSISGQSGRELTLVKMEISRRKQSSP